MSISEDYNLQSFSFLLTHFQHSRAPFLTFYIRKYSRITFYFWLRQELDESQSSFVHPSVRLVQVCLELSIFIFLAQVSLRPL